MDCWVDKKTGTYADTLEAIGDLLCGIYDDRIYDIGIALKVKEEERTALRSQLKNLWAILGDTDQVLAGQRDRYALTRKIVINPTRKSTGGPAAPATIAPFVTLLFSLSAF